MGWRDHFRNIENIEKDSTFQKFEYDESKTFIENIEKDSQETKHHLIENFPKKGGITNRCIININNKVEIKKSRSGNPSHNSQNSHNSPSVDILRRNCKAYPRTGSITGCLPKWCEEAQGAWCGECEWLIKM